MQGCTCRDARRGPWCRGARGDPWCWGARAGVHREISDAGVHMQSCTGRFWCWCARARVRKEIRGAGLHAQGCTGRSLVLGCTCRCAWGGPWCRGAYAGVHEEVPGTGARVHKEISCTSSHVQGCIGRFTVLVCTHSTMHRQIPGAVCTCRGAQGDQYCHCAPASLHREILGAGVHVQGCRDRSGVLCVQGCTETSVLLVHTPSDARGRCRAAPSLCVHCTGRSAFLGSLPVPCLRACTGLRAWAFPCKIARLRSFCSEEVASISDLLLQAKRQVGISEMCTCVVGTILPNSAGMEAQSFPGLVAAALVHHCKGYGI